MSLDMNIEHVDQISDIKQFFNDPKYPSLMYPEEKLLLYTLVRTLQPDRVLEIGTMYGGSAKIITKALDDIGKGRLVCVDPYPDLRIEWETIAHRAILLRGFSPGILGEAHKRVGGDFDFCLIDGNHDYNQVLADTLGVLPYLAPESYLLFHDAYYPEVRDAIDDVLATTVGFTDCGMLCRTKWVDEKGHEEPKGATWCGLRLVRVPSRCEFRIPDRLVRAIQELTAATPLIPQKLCLTAVDIAAHVPPGKTFIFVDDGRLENVVAAGRPRLPFLERDGRYWGKPSDDATAVRELERLRKGGAGFLVFAWPAFWWLDHYADFHRHLRERFRCVLENDRLVIFDLRAKAGPDGKTAAKRQPERAGKPARPDRGKAASKGH